MHFTVTWLPAALRQLADLWNSSSNRSGLNAAANRVDRLLRLDPQSKGNDYYGDRILVVAPLQVIFRVRPDDMLVEILQVW